MANVKEYKMFQGCTIGNRIPFIEASARKVFDTLKIKTSDAPFACCPDPVGFNSVDHTSWLAMGARNLTIAEEENKDIVSLCNGCFQTLKTINHELKKYEDKKKEINDYLKSINKEFKGTINVKHFVELLHDIEPDKIIDNIKINFSGIKVACHTGCHYNRPSEIMQTDDPMKPRKLRDIVRLTGAITIDYDEEMLCCGSAVGNIEEGPSMQILKNKFDSAIKAGAEAFIVICPACFQQMDANQRNLSKIYGDNYELPILYLTELLALAFGSNPEDIGLKFHRTKVNSILDKIK